MSVELFHQLADPDSAECRRAIVDLGLEGRVALRNVFYDSHKAAFAALGGQRVPALWSGTALVEGKEAVLAALSALR